MEGEHRGAPTLKDVVAGSRTAAAEQRARAQRGAAAAARKGRAVRVARATGKSKRSKAVGEDAAIEAEVERSMQKGTTLVQAAIEHLETAERLWDKWVQESNVTIDGYPTEKQVVTFMSKLSRTRQRMCLAQRGTRRNGGQRSVIKNYVSEMANNLWDSKYKPFGELEPRQQQEYWSKIFGAYKAMYAAASAAPASEADEERSEQLIAQTEAVYKRAHCYRTEMFQLQDACIGEKENVNEALIAHAAIAIMQSTAARVGMFTKTRHDGTSVRWKKENPLRVRDVIHKVRKLVLTKAKGQCEGEATSHMQINWRRVKKQYFEVYLFRSAVTANAVSAVRRTTTILKAMQMRFGRYRACRNGLTPERLQQHEAWLTAHGYIRLRDTVYSTWEEMHAACEKDAWRYVDGAKDDPLLPEVQAERVSQKEALHSRHVYQMLERLGLKLGYEPNKFGLWSIRKYSIAMVVKAFGIYLGTRQGQHSKVCALRSNGT
jgi:hypothetical protein